MVCGSTGLVTKDYFLKAMAEDLNPLELPIVVPLVCFLMPVYCIENSEVVKFPNPSLPEVVDVWLLYMFDALVGPALLESIELPLMLAPYLVAVLMDSKSPLSRICFTF